jgi:hypothetical protein
MVDQLYPLNLSFDGLRVAENAQQLQVILSRRFKNILRFHNQLFFTFIDNMYEIVHGVEITRF